MNAQPSPACRMRSGDIVYIKRAVTPVEIIEFSTTDWTFTGRYTNRHQHQKFHQDRILPSKEWCEYVDELQVRGGWSNYKPSERLRDGRMYYYRSYKNKIQLTE